MENSSFTILLTSGEYQCVWLAVFPKNSSLTNTQPPSTTIFNALKANEWHSAARLRSEDHFTQRSLADLHK